MEMTLAYLAKDATGDHESTYIPQEPASTSSARSTNLGSRIVCRDPFAIAVMAAVTTLDPSAVAVNRWGLYFPQSTTLCIASKRHPIVVQVDRAEPATEQVSEVLRLLGLSKTQLKEALGVSRQTIYDWLSGKFDPEDEKAERLATLRNLARVVEDRLGGPLPPRALREVSVGGRTLLDLLVRPQTEQSLLRSAITGAVSGVLQMRGRSARASRQRQGVEMPSEGQLDEVLDANASELDRAG